MHKKHHMATTFRGRKVMRIGGVILHISLGKDTVLFFQITQSIKTNFKNIQLIIEAQIYEKAGKASGFHYFQQTLCA